MSKKRINRLILISLLGINVISGCSGYKFSHAQNPLKAYGIKNVSVPLFVNRSSLQAVSPELTREFISMLTRYKGLKVTSGESKSSDALILGIVSSSDKINNVKKVASSKFTSGELKQSIGGRQEFFVPSSIQYTLYLDVYIIKDPSWEDKKLLMTDVEKFVKDHPKVIVYKKFETTGTYRQSTEKNILATDGGAVDSTKSLGNYHLSLQAMAKSLAATFKNEVLDVF